MKAIILRRIAGQGTVDFSAGLSRAEFAARRALAIAPKLGSAYIPLALIEADRFAFESALQNLERALALAPNNVGVMSNASFFMQWFGDGHKALGLANRSIALDPLLAANYGRKSEILWSLRDYPAAIAAGRKTLELAPGLSIAHLKIANSLLFMGRHGEARAEYDKLPADDVLGLTGKAVLATRSKDNVAGERLIGHMRELFGANASYQYAQYYAQAGDANRAFDELDNAVRVKDPGLLSLKCDPFLDPIVRDPRYSALLKRLNFPTWG
jgi:tetratricopeptide (TPR) repeat protein